LQNLLSSAPAKSGRERFDPMSVTKYDESAGL
jgi:hypothetical protein